MASGSPKEIEQNETKSSRMGRFDCGVGGAFSSSGFLRRMPAAPKVTEEGQRTAKALSEAFGAVAEFAGRRSCRSA